MMSASDLTSLLARVEAAEGPDRALFIEVAEALGASLLGD